MVRVLCNFIFFKKEAIIKNVFISLVMPILTREVTIHMDPGSSSNATIDLSNLGFLLGTIPAAPGTLFYAMQYNVAVDMVRHHMKLHHI